MDRDYILAIVKLRREELKKERAKILEGCKLTRSGRSVKLHEIKKELAILALIYDMAFNLPKSYHLEECSEAMYGIERLVLKRPYKKSEED